MRMLPLLMPTFAFCCIVCFIKQSVQTRQSIIIVMRMASYNLPTFSLSCIICFIQWNVNWQGNMTDVLSFLKQNHFFWVASTICITTRRRFVLFSGRSIQKTLHMHFHWLPFANYMKISWPLYIPVKMLCSRFLQWLVKLWFEILFLQLKINEPLIRLWHGTSKVCINYVIPPRFNNGLLDWALKKGVLSMRVNFSHDRPKSWSVSAVLVSTYYN